LLPERRIPGVLSEMPDRYEFGANWASFVERSYSHARREAAGTSLLDFLGVPNLRGLSFLDIGSGSGLHSLAAHDAGASPILSFDFDEMAVRTTARLREVAGAPADWRVERGDVLDDTYIERLGAWDIVYAWGVLHHTGSMWRAVANAAKRVAPGGRFFVALYSSNVAVPSAEFWLEVKRRYNAAGPAGRRWLEWWYLWRFGLGKNPLRLPLLIRQIRGKGDERGMSYMTDVRDWLGGWPMEYADDQEVVDFLEERHGFQLARIATGDACTQFLFHNAGSPGRKTVARDLAARRGCAAPPPLR